MILFVNVYLDDKLGSPIAAPNDRYLLPKHSKVDILRYTLHSYTALKHFWSKCVFFIELEKSLKHRQAALYEEIDKLFPGCVIEPERNCRQKMWKAALEKHVFSSNDDLVWYAGNHDHPFIDRNTDALEALLAALSKSTDRYKSTCYSHFYEIYHFFQQYSGFNIYDDGVIGFDTDRRDAMMIVNQELLKTWWEGDYGDRFIPRTDWYPGVNGVMHHSFMHAKEICRHFDGYTFRGDVFNPHDLPPLDTPQGFFENNVKIQYGHPTRKAGWTWVNPLIPEYRAVDEAGVDYKCLLDDLPMFWEGHVSEIDVAPDLDQEALCKARNLAYWHMACPRRTHEITLQSRPDAIPFLREQRPDFPEELRRYWTR